MMNIPFVKTNLYGMAISSVLLVITLISLSFKGLTLGLDFTGGVSLELKYEQKADLERIRQSISKIENANFVVLNYGSDENVLISNLVTPNLFASITFSKEGAPHQNFHY